MRGFEAKDFPDSFTYDRHKNALRRAQRTSKSLFDLWNSVTGWFPEDSGYYYEIMSLLDDAVQIGYEQALGIPHKSSDYDIDNGSIDGYTGACDFYKHQYFVYNCEEECARKNNGLECKLEVKEYLD